MLMVTWTGRVPSPKSVPPPRRRIRSAKIRRPGRPGLREQHHELLAAVAGHDVHRALFALGRIAPSAPQHPVAGQVAVRVVDVLEVVDVHHQAGQHRVVAVGALQFLDQLVRQRAAIEGVGERVGLRQVFICSWPITALSRSYAFSSAATAALITCSAN